MYRTWKFLREYSLLLIIGAGAALIWANISPESYHALVELSLWENAPVGHWHIGPEGHPQRTLTVHI